jgi:hypothetical protein
MENDHTISGLIRKRAELAGQLEAAQNTVRRLIIDLDNIDAAIHIFNPDIVLEAIKPKPLPPKNQAFKGEVSRAVFGALRNSGRPMTAPELAQHVMAERGLDTSDKRLVKLIGKRVGACLRHHRTKGLVESEEGPGQFMLWDLNQ